MSRSRMSREAGFRVFAFLNVLWVVVAAEQAFNPCPNVWTYQDDYRRGVITLPYRGENEFNLSLKVSLQDYMKNAKLRIRMLTSMEELLSATQVKYEVILPVTNAPIKVTEIKLNDRLYCSSVPFEPVPGKGVTNVWSGLQFMGQIKYVPQIQTIIPTPSVTAPIPQRSYIDKPKMEMSYLPDINFNNPYKACGVTNNIQSLIVGGQETFKYPWLVAIFIYNVDTQSYQYKCTGNLISDRHIVTAAHCVQFFKTLVVSKEDLTIVLGKADIRRWATNGAETRGVKSIYVNNDYQQYTGIGDLAVMVLDRPVVLKKTLRPICLWEGSVELQKGSFGIVAGWGKTNSTLGNPTSVSITREINLPIVPQEECLWSNPGYQKITSNKTFCAGYRPSEGDPIRKGPCTGDSGAGFMMVENNKYYLRGITSVSLAKDRTCDLTNYLVFADVGKYTSWIKSILEKS